MKVKITLAPHAGSRIELDGVDISHYVTGIDASHHIHGLPTVTLHLVPPHVEIDGDVERVLRTLKHVHDVVAVSGKP